MKHTPSEDLIVWKFDFALTTFFEVETDLFKHHIPSRLNPMEVSPGIGLVNITAFNFPMAVWAWNAALAYVCGDACVWKPSSSTPLCGIGLTNVVRPVLDNAPLLHHQNPVEAGDGGQAVRDGDDRFAFHQIL